MKISGQNIAKYIRMYALVFWGLASILYIAGDPVDECLSFRAFCLLKLAGFVSLGLCCYVGLCLHKADMLPNMADDNDCKSE